MQFTHGIVTDSHVLYSRPTDNQLVRASVDTSRLTSVGAFIDMANHYGVTQLWVLPGTALSERFSTYDDTFVTGCLGTYRLFPKELDPYITGRHTERPGKEVSLVLPAYIRGLPGAVPALTRDVDLYAYVAYLQDTLGVSYMRDAKGTGIALLDQVNSNPQRKAYIRPVQRELTPFYEHKALDMQWSRPLTADETRLGYLHVIDRNVMYLGAMAGLHVGAGTYYHGTNQHPTFYKNVPGLWLVTLSGTSPCNGRDLPGLFDVGNSQEVSGWLDTAMVQAAIDCGYLVQVQECYVFLESHTTLTPWYDIVRTARLNLMSPTSKYKNKVACTAALDTLKMMYRQMIGLMGRTPGANESPKWYSRPDMFNAVVSEARHKMYLTLLQLQAASIPVVGVYVDGIYLLSNQPIEETLPAGIVISDQIGKFKHVATYPLTPDIVAMCTSNPQTLVQGLARLNKEEVTA